jgi:putative addiction module CopG family antidote
VDQMNVSTTGQLAGYVSEKVKGGRYNNASEVIREALQLMEEEDERALRLAKPLPAMPSMLAPTRRRMMPQAIAAGKKIMPISQLTFWRTSTSLQSDIRRPQRESVVSHSLIGTTRRHRRKTNCCGRSARPNCQGTPLVSTRICI